jgi:phosphatidylglycerol---prolipoprotein diacylglyceryl transferase
LIPYFVVPDIHVGPWRISPFSPLLVSAVLLGTLLALRRGRTHGLSPDLVFRVSFWALVSGLAGAHLAKLTMDHTSLVFSDPMIILKTTRGIRSLGAFFGGLLGAVVYCRLRKVSYFEIFHLLDVIAWALPFAWMVGRLGCALVHDHRGLATTSWIGVRFPEGTRYDLGLIEFLFLIGLSVMFYWLGRKPRVPGFFFALFAIVYGAFRVWLDTLHVQPFRYYGGAVGVALGLIAWRAASVSADRFQSREDA